MVLGGTLTALIAAAMVGVIVSGLLHIVTNKQDYLYLFDAYEMICEKLKGAQESLNEYGKKYRQNKDLKDVTRLVS